MKSYLCIGGPLHGQTRAIHGRGMSVPVCGSCGWIGAEEITRDDLLRCGIRETRYTVKPVIFRDSKSAIGNDGRTTATVTVDARTDVLVHESLLTSEEVLAWFVKLNGYAACGNAIDRARSMMKL